MAGSRAAWSDQTPESSLLEAQKEKEAAFQERKKLKERFQIPGDKGSTVDKIREANKKRKEAMEE